MTHCITTRTLTNEEWTRYRGPEEERCFGTLRTPQGHLPLRDMKLTGRITGLAYRLSLSQRFVNHYSATLEATYIFPLPARAAVTSFIMRTSDSEIHGELRERGQAREIYDRAMSEGFQAAITEEERPEVFTLRVGNIPPGERIEVELELSGPLLVADGMATFRFPLVVAPRYIPGPPLLGPNVGDGVHADTTATPDASRISPPVLLGGYPNPVRLAIDIELDGSGLPPSVPSRGEASLDYRTIYSSHQRFTIGPSHSGLQRLSLAPGTGQIDRDLILRFPLLSEEIRSSLSTFIDADGSATWALTLLPSASSQAPQGPRNLVVLLDRSGSMEGWKMAAARRATGRIVDCFTDQDRFSVLLFDESIEDLAESGCDWRTSRGARPLLAQASDRNRFSALQALSRVEARGGTELGEAMLAGVRRLSQVDGERFMVVVTDGQVGNEDEILRHIQRQAQGIRIFTVGIDEAVNASLLQRLAQFSGGHCELVESEERLDQVMRLVQQRIGQPLLTDIKVLLNGFDLAPTHIDLYPGLPARIYGRYQGQMPSSVTVQGRDRQGSIWRQVVAVHPTQDRMLESLWARERLLELEHGFMTQKPGRQHTAAGITQFSLAHNVLCRFTSFVAVDRHRRVAVGGPREHVVQAVETPRGWSPPPATVSRPQARLGLQRTSAPAGPILLHRPTLGGAPPQPLLGRCQKPGPAPSGRSRDAFDSSLDGPAPGRLASKAQTLSQAHAQDTLPLEVLLERLEYLTGDLKSHSRQAKELLEKILELLADTGIRQEVLGKGYKVLDNLRVQHPGAAARCSAWLGEVRGELLAAPEAAREGWWKG